MPDLLCKASVWFFPIQGIIALVFAAWCGWISERYERRIRKLEYALNRSSRRGRRDRASLESLLADVPTLEPLKCGDCGAGLLLREQETFCPHCRIAGPLPADYERAAKLKATVRHLFKLAVRYWRIARLLTRPWVVRLGGVLLVAELGLVFAALRGAHMPTFPWLERLFFQMHMEKSAMLTCMALFGFAMFVLVFIALVDGNRRLRPLVSAHPALRQQVGERELASCQSCAGQMVFDRNAAVAICPYCNVVNIRSQHLRQEQAGMEEERTGMLIDLLGAKTILDEFLMRFFGVLFVALIVLMVFLRHWIGSLLHSL